MDNITHTSTPSSLSGFSPASEGEGRCRDCNAPHGHFVVCPRINRNTAEALSYSKADIIRAAALGVNLG